MAAEGMAVKDSEVDMAPVQVAGRMGRAAAKAGR